MIWFWLVVAIVLTGIGDYLIKIASQDPSGMTSWQFFAGAICYGGPTVCWFFLMKELSLAEIGAFYTSATVLILAFLGYAIFGEPFGKRELAGVTLAIASVVVMSTGSSN